MIFSIVSLEAPFLEGDLLSTTGVAHMEEKNESTLPAGRLRISRRAGKGDSKTLSTATPWCVVTFWDPEGDLKIRKTYGVAGLRRHKLLRITSEALQQGFPLSQDLVSFDILGCGLRTLQRDVAHFAAAGVFVPFQRISLNDRKRRYTYPVAAAKLYLEGRSQQEIAATLYQNVELVDGFVRNFAKIVRLAISGIGQGHMGTVTQVSEALIEEYLLLFKEYNTPQLFMRLDLFTRTAR
jgi:Protein of unknown function (DUF1670)